MHIQTFISSCALALTANAVLVPPHVDAEFWDSTDPIMVASSRKSLNLPCNNCPIAIGNKDGHPKAWKDGARTELEMEFAVDGKQLKMNGQAFYPASPHTISSPLFVKQVYAGDEANTVGELYDGKIPVSNAVDVHQKMEVASVRMDGGDHHITKLPMRRISFEILGLANNVVRVDTVEVLVSESDDNLQIFGVNTTPYTKHSTPAADACKTVFCRIDTSIRAKLAQWRAASASRFGAIKKGCMRQIKTVCSKLHIPVPGPNTLRPYHHKGHKGPKIHGGINKFTGSATLAPGGHNHPHGPFGGKKHHGHHHMHHGASHALRVVVRFSRHVVMPIMIGIAAGMAVSGIGMLIGQAIVLLFLRARRNRGYQSVEQDEAGEETRESFEELPKYEEAAPHYVDDAPAYVDEKAEEQK